MEGEQAIIRKGESSGKKPEDFGKMEHGCKHYKRRCQIRAPCCDKIFPCRHCHNEYTNNLENPQERHKIVRTQVKQVICSICDTEQQVARVCSQCGVNMGEYFCDICKFYDDDTGKGQFHCNHCGICRLGGQENYFHCKKCDACYAIDLRDNHICWAGVMRNKCPVCKEELFDSLESSLVLKCGHTMHVRCGEEMVKSARYACPVCNKSMVDMSVAWAELDKMIAKIQMPLSLRYKVWVLCNDCSERSEVNYHSVGMKCSNCNSYNTSNTSATPKELPQ